MEMAHEQLLGILDTPRTGPFMYDFIDEVDALAIEGVSACIAKLPIVEMNFTSPYTVLIDRLSHVLPYFRTYLKNAVLNGAYVINNPFWYSADDKFLNCSIAVQHDIAIPKTVCLPSKLYPDGFESLDLQNLIYPLNWEEAIEYVGFPAVLKPYNGHGWKDVYIVRDRSQLMQVFDRSGQAVMMLQEYIHFEDYIRCFVLGKKYVLPVRYHPDTRSYDPAIHFLDIELEKRICQDSLTLVSALDYDMNTIEFAIRDGIPYAIDFMNPIPDFHPEHITEGHYRWVLKHMALSAVETLKRETQRPKQLCGVIPNSPQ